MSNLTLLHDVLLILAGIAGGVVFALLYWLHRRLKTGVRTPAQPSPFQNMTEMSILFQTMRDLVREQRTLARDFNRGLDAKVEVVREAVRQVLAGHEHLLRLQKEFKEQVEQAKRETAARAADSVDERLGIAPASDFSNATEAPEPVAPELPEEDEDDLPPFHAIAQPEDADFIDEWQPLEPRPEEEPEAVSQPDFEEQDPEIQREAYRALLNLDQPATPAAPENASAPDEPAVVPDEPAFAPYVPSNGNGNGNGNGSKSGNGNGNGALRSRVYKYHDAGMSISTIAQELGVGKGEIRLMLSLRDK